MRIPLAILLSGLGACAHGPARAYDLEPTPTTLSPPRYAESRPRAGQFGGVMFEEHDIPVLGKLAPSARPEPISVKAPTVNAPVAPAQEKRQVIYNGSLGLQVVDVEEAENKVAAIAEDMGGWVEKLDRPSVTLRVPATRFRDTMTAVSALGTVIDKKISASDVTEKYRDLKIRLDNAEKIRTRLELILAQAKNVTEALAVERELGRVTEEIERLKGQIKALEDRVAYSAVTVELRLTLPRRIRPTQFPFPWLRGLGAESLLRF